VDGADWTYSARSVGPINLKPEERVALVFEELGAIVDVCFNKHVLFSMNVHIAHTINVTDLLRGKMGAPTLGLKFQNVQNCARREQAYTRSKGSPSDINFDRSERLFCERNVVSLGLELGCGSKYFRPVEVCLLGSLHFSD
jgi:hypothetical protein